MPRVFISYRRDDTGQAASALALLLRDHLSTDVVFLDHDDMEFGEPWRRYLTNAIVDRDVVLCLIGRGWEGSTDDPDRRRIDDPGDAVRQEIATASAAGVRILTVRVDRDDVPTDLPADIHEAIGESQVVPLRSTDYQADFAVVLVKLWELRLKQLPACHVVLTVGTTDIGCREFISALRHGHTSSGEVRVVTLAATGRMTLSLVDAKELAPRLFTLYLTDDANEQDRRLVAAWGLPGPWDKVAVVTGGLATGFSFANLIAEPGYEWLATAISETGSIDVATNGAGGIASGGSPTSGSAWGRVRHAVAARPRIALLASALAVGGGVAVVANQGDDNGDEVVAGTTVPGEEVDSPEALLAALLRAGDAAAAEPDATPIERLYIAQQFPCMAEFVVDRLGPAEIKQRVGVTVASLDAAIATGSDIYLENLILVEEDGESTYDFDYYLDRTDAVVDCAGGLLEAARWDLFSSQSFGSSVAVEDGFAHVDCVMRYAEPSDDELAADVYYWYYADGGTGGPLSDDPESYFELAGEYSAQKEDAKDVCGYGP